MAMKKQLLEDRSSDPLFLQSVARAFDVLEVFASAPHEKSLGEIAAAADITKSAAQRISQTLIAIGYLERGESGGVRLGKRILDRSFDYLRSNALVERASPIMTELRKRADERVDLSLFDGTSIVYALRQQSKRETFYATLSGRRMPTFLSSGGRACLSHLPDDEVDEIITRSTLVSLTPKTIVDVPSIWKKIRDAREVGYAYTQEEALLGEMVLAAAVVDASGRPLGAIHIAASLSEWTVKKFCDRFAPLAIEAARALSLR
jgi:DNA-binding IclR family transcriptional regulator